MASPFVPCFAAICFFALTPFASAQQPLSAWTVTADGMTLAQVSPAIEQSRLYRQAAPSSSLGVDPNGAALPAADSSSSADDSFGDQLILKSQPRARNFVVSGDASIFYTDNVALTRRDRTDDAFFVGRAAASWTPRLAAGLEAQLGAAASVFTYSDNSALDFTNLTIGGGLYWSPAKLRGVTFFARYDFIELLDSDGEEALQDHEFTLGVQRVFALGRSHAITIGATAMIGFSNPDAAQRDQLGVFVGYRALLTRSLETEIFYRAALHDYNDADRLDFNQVISWNLRCRFTPWAEANAFLSYGDNRSDRSAFDYRVFTAGAGVGFTVRF